jgi:hypothetical protein
MGERGIVSLDMPLRISLWIPTRVCVPLLPIDPFDLILAENLLQFLIVELIGGEELNDVLFFGSLLRLLDCLKVRERIELRYRRADNECVGMRELFSPLLP